MEPELPAQYQTTYKQDFVDKELPVSETLGRRVMMTQNMQDIKGAGDGLWRKEHDIVARNLVVEGVEDAPSNFSSKPYYGVTGKGGLGRDTSFSTPVTESLKAGFDLGGTTDKYYHPESSKP